MQIMIAEVARDDRLEEKARKRSAWLDKHYRMEADVMTTRMGIMTEKSGRKPNFAVQSQRKFRGRMKRVSDMVMEIGVVEEVDDQASGNILSN